MDENLAALSLHQWPQTFTHPPADVAQNLQAFWPGNEKRDAIVPQDSYGFGKAVECLQLEAGEIEALELFFRKHSEIALSRQQSAFSHKIVWNGNTSLKHKEMRGGPSLKNQTLRFLCSSVFQRFSMVPTQVL